MDMCKTSRSLSHLLMSFLLLLTGLYIRSVYLIRPPDWFKLCQ